MSPALEGRFLTTELAGKSFIELLAFFSLTEFLVTTYLITYLFPFYSVCSLRAGNMSKVHHTIPNTVSGLGIPLFDLVYPVHSLSVDSLEV